MCKKLFCIVSIDTITQENLIEGGNFNEARGGCQSDIDQLLNKVPNGAKNTLKNNFKVVELNVNEQKIILNKNFTALKKNSNARIIKISHWN